MSLKTISQRQRTNLTLPESLLREAKTLNINLSQACERGLAQAVAERKAAAWLRQNQAAMAEWNAHVEQNGLPLAAFRSF